MEFLQDRVGGDLPRYLGDEATYNDMFLVPVHNRTVKSRGGDDLELSVLDESGMGFPVVLANMRALVGRRACETAARHGALGTITQDEDLVTIRDTVDYIKSRNAKYDTAVIIGPETTAIEANIRMLKRSHGAAVVMKDGRPAGILTSENLAEANDLDTAGSIMSTDFPTMPDGLEPKAMFEWFEANGDPKIAPVMSGDEMLGIMSEDIAFDLINFRQALDEQGRFRVAAAVGINGQPDATAAQLLEMGVDLLVADTANGDQGRAFEAVKLIRAEANRFGKKVLLAAGNVVTADATKGLIDCGADIVKVGVGPGSTCKTRLLTGVGRPQFTAVLECAGVAKVLGKGIWADGGVKHPRDVALALAAGARAVMVGTWFIGTHESSAEMQFDGGRMYKEAFGMASTRAVKLRTADASLSRLERRQRARWDEGADAVRVYLDSRYPGMPHLLGLVDSGTRSSFAYENASNQDEFHERALAGYQTTTGYGEGLVDHATWANKRG